MMKKLKCFLFIVFPTLIFAQQINGKIYNSKGVIKDIEIINTSNSEKIHSNELGLFSISAKVNDTLIFNSLFYEKQQLIINQSHFNDLVIIELKKKINSLDEVIVQNQASSQAIFKKNKTGIKNLLAEDIKKNPHKYGLTLTGKSNVKGNIAEVLGLVASLFKNKKTKNDNTFQKITPEHLIQLFQDENIFNAQLLEKDLKIQKEYTQLFFEYFSERQVNTKLLNKKRHFELLEFLVKYAEEFNQILSEN